MIDFLHLDPGLQKAGPDLCHTDPDLQDWLRHYTFREMA